MTNRLTMPATGDGEAQRLSPTDISQFVRLEQCQRYLRLRLHERNADPHFMRTYGVAPQSIPPLLRQSGATFESRMLDAVPANVRVVNFALDRPDDRLDDNHQVLREIADLAPASAALLFQPRLETYLNEWLVRGDIDVLRVERDAKGSLHLLLVDIKSSTKTRVEHRLQVAFYLEMLTAITEQAGIAPESARIGILYRGPAEEPGHPDEAREYARQRADARHYFYTDAALLEIVSDPDNYRGSVHDLVTAPDSVARRGADAPFETVPYHLTYKCDGCVYNEFCMKWSAEHDDLSLIPHLTASEKSALQSNGITCIQELASLKTQDPRDRSRLVTPNHQEARVRSLAATWPVGPRLDELIHRAHSYRRTKGDSYLPLANIPSKGHGSLPFSSPEHNPNLVRVFIDAQHDYLHDRVYLLGALVVANQRGDDGPRRRQEVVRMTDGPPETDTGEEALIADWVEATIQAIADQAFPDAHGDRRAPIHLIFYNSFAQALFLEALARHFKRVMATTPLYDFATQLAAYDSPVVTFLDQEIREHRNYPIVCQSLQAIARYLGFDWNRDVAFTRVFKRGLFDASLKLSSNDQEEWYTGRSRFNSQIPLEYAYAAWGLLEQPVGAKPDDYRPYAGATVELLTQFHARRLEAMEWITATFEGNRETTKSPFDLTILDQFTDKAATLAHALDEFTTIERHVAVSEWKRIRNIPPERRVLAGDTLIVRYLEEDQPPEIVERNRENERRRQLREQYEQAYLDAHPGTDRPVLTDEQTQETKWSQNGLQVRLRIETTDIECSLTDMLALTSIAEGERVILHPRWSVDSRLPAEQQRPYTPTPKELLYAMRAVVVSIAVEPDGQSAFVTLEMVPNHGNTWRGYVFPTMRPKNLPLVPNTRYTIDIDPNDWYGRFCAEMTAALTQSSAARDNTLYQRLQPVHRASVGWPAAAAAGQERFLAGLEQLAIYEPGLAFEESKRGYIGGYGDEPILLVQGPPGTGKSYSTAFAILARIQGAMAAGIPSRIFISCKTHAATDVLLYKIVDALEELRRYQTRYPQIFAASFDPRLLDLAIFRLKPRTPSDAPIVDLPTTGKSPKALDQIVDESWCLVAGTPGGVRAMVKEKWKGDLFGHAVGDCLVLDEASQMNLPEAIMAALTLKPDGQLIVVGDHRQMPPIIKHDWANEPRRTFQEFRSYESLFLTLLPRQSALVQFKESFRLHAVMAEFLRREIYAQDGIDFHSRQMATIAPASYDDPFLAAVLDPRYPLVVIVHDEMRSQLSNAFETELLKPVLEALADAPHHLDAEKGLGVVVPHRAQRALYRSQVPCLAEIDSSTGEVRRWAVETVEKFQGDERVSIVVSTTESDPEYLLQSSEFLLDPRRLNVALSRARCKMILAASRSVFSLFSTDEETFRNAQLWKNLLRHTCTTQLWNDIWHGQRVQVWGKLA